MAKPFPPVIRRAFIDDDCLPEKHMFNTRSFGIDIDAPSISLPFNYPSTATNTLQPVLPGQLFGYKFDPTLDFNGEKRLTQVCSCSYQFIVSTQDVGSIFLYSDYSQQLIQIVNTSSAQVFNTIPVFGIPGSQFYVVLSKPPSPTNGYGYLNLTFYNFLIPPYPFVEGTSVA